MKGRAGAKSNHPCARPELMSPPPPALDTLAGLGFWRFIGSLAALWFPS